MQLIAKLMIIGSPIKKSTSSISWWS